eukprot:860447_1
MISFNTFHSGSKARDPRHYRCAFDNTSKCYLNLRSDPFDLELWCSSIYTTISTEIAWVDCGLFKDLCGLGYHLIISNAQDPFIHSFYNQLHSFAHNLIARSVRSPHQQQQSQQWLFTMILYIHCDH